MRQSIKSFLPVFIIERFSWMGCICDFFSGFIYFAPNALGHPDNYIPANPMSTPAHCSRMVFLPVYAILEVSQIN